MSNCPCNFVVVTVTPTPGGGSPVVSALPPITGPTYIVWTLVDPDATHKFDLESVTIKDGGTVFNRKILSTDGRSICIEDSCPPGDIKTYHYSVTTPDGGKVDPSIDNEPH